MWRTFSPLLHTAFLATLPGYSSSAWCSNGSHLTQGRWSPTTHEWELLSPNSPCNIANLTGSAALRSLKGARLLFLGDSILRQTFHGFVHSNLRGMPVVIDPVYGWAHYTAALPDEAHPFARDSLTAMNKDLGRLHGYDSIAQLGTSPLQGSCFQVPRMQARRSLHPSPASGWSQENGVEVLFSFLNACDHVMLWLTQLKKKQARSADNQQE